MEAAAKSCEGLHVAGVVPVRGLWGVSESQALNWVGRC